jgi:sigma-B regulation protein RsbU (phosphoserine phosphatase)
MAPSVPFFNRLAVRLAGVILLLGFLAVPLVSELKRQNVERLVLQQAELQAATATIAVVDGLQEGLRSAEAAVRYVARDLESRELSAAGVDAMLRNVLAANRGVTECSLTYEPFVFDPKTERFGRYANRGRSGLVLRDLAVPAYAYWKRPWYTEALGRDRTGWSEPFFDQGGADANVVRVAAPFYRTVNGRRSVAGVVAAGFDLAWVNELARKYDFFDSGYVMIFSSEGRLIAHPNPEFVVKETMESLAQKFNQPELATIHQRVLGNRQGALTYFSSILQRRVHENYKPTQIAGWGVVVGYAESEFLQQVNAVRWITMGALALTLVVLAAIVLLATQMGLKPLQGLTAVAEEIGRGQLDGELPPPRRDDEIGRLSRSFGVMRDVLRANRVLELQVQAHATALAAANDKLTGELLERRWVNQALEHQLRYNQLIIDSISDAVIVLTKAMHISRINPAVVHLTGFEAKDLVNEPLHRLVRLEGGPARMVDPLGQALKEGRDVRDQTAVAVTRTGQPVAVRLTLFPLRDHDTVVGAVAILRAVELPSAPIN